MKRVSLSVKVFGPGPQNPGEFRSFCLHEQPPAEARLMGAAARQLRCARRAAGYSRGQFAARLGVCVDVLVAIENGYGTLAVTQPLVERATRLAAGANP